VSRVDSNKHGLLLRRERRNSRSKEIVRWVPGAGVGRALEPFAATSSRRNGPILRHGMCRRVV